MVTPAPLAAFASATTVGCTVAIAALPATPAAAVMAAPPALVAAVVPPAPLVPATAGAPAAVVPPATVGAPAAVVPPATAGAPAAVVPPATAGAPPGHPTTAAGAASVVMSSSNSGICLRACRSACRDHPFTRAFGSLCIPSTSCRIATPYPPHLGGNAARSDETQGETQDGQAADFSDGTIEQNTAANRAFAGHIIRKSATRIPLKRVLPHNRVSTL